MPTAPGCTTTSRSTCCRRQVDAIGARRCQHPPVEPALAAQARRGRPPTSASSRPLTRTPAARAPAARDLFGAPLERRGDEPAEQRVRPGRPRAELGVRLGGHEVRVRLARQLDELDQPAVGRRAGDDQPGGFERRPVVVVDLVAVPVPLFDVRLAVHLADDASRRAAWPGRGRAASCRPCRAPPRRRRVWSAIVAMTGCGVAGSNSAELASARPARSRAHSITMHCRPRHRPSVGMQVLARVAQRADLALDAAHAEPAGDHHAVDAARARARRPRGVAQSSDGTQRMFTRASLAKPPARSASVTDR